MSWPRLAWRQLRRDLAAGDVRILLAALVVAVMAVSSVGFLTDRAERALAMEANRLLGGDAVLRADQPITGPVRDAASAPGLRQTETISFPSMIRVGESLRLGDIRALGEGFPLRGSFRIISRAGGVEHEAGDIPALGTVWLNRAGADALGARIGDEIGIGSSRLRLVALVVQEPDAALDYFNTAPKLFLHRDDLAATGLVQDGSRISYRLVVAGEAAAVEKFTAAAKANLGRGQRLETAADARPLKNSPPRPRPISAAASDWKPPRMRGRKSARRWIAPAASSASQHSCPSCWPPSPSPWPRAGTAPGTCRVRR